MCGQVINLLTLAGLWTVFGVPGPSVTGVTNLLTLAGLWTIFGVVRPSVTNLLTSAGLYFLDCNKTAHTPADPDRLIYTIFELS